MVYVFVGFSLKSLIKLTSSSLLYGPPFYGPPFYGPPSPRYSHSIPRPRRVSLSRPAHVPVSALVGARHQP